MPINFEDIDSPQSLKHIPPGQLPEFADYLRNFLIERIAEQGGHFAANLGTVELAIALHYVYNSPKDKLVWDVGHQAYAHKILTGRKKDFKGLRKLNGLSGFPAMNESVHDAFGTGHSSTSISAVLGYAVAARQLNDGRDNIAIIGDGALSAGQAFEALNNAGLSGTNITVVINDNHIGIDPSQGAMGEYLEQLEFRDDNLFTDFGFKYFGPVDGHNITELVTIFKQLRFIDGPKVVHIKTLKGKGYKAAEEEQTKWHSTSQFDKLSGRSLSAVSALPKYQDIFGQTLLKLAEENKNVVAVTPAMISGSSLHYMQNKYPERVFDVGIAEQHAVTFSAGLAAGGLRPFCCIYSTFLQRGYDQLIHDVALQNLPVIFAVDRAGLVGEDGPTHHGVFDIAFLQAIPGLVIVSPRNGTELKDAMATALNHSDSPFIIRYPRGKVASEMKESGMKTQVVGRAECLREGKDLCIISHGTIAEECIKAIDRGGASIAHFDFKYLKPLDTETLKQIFNEFGKILVVEEGQRAGGFAGTIALQAFANNYRGQLRSIAIEDKFIPYGSVAELFEISAINAKSIEIKIKELINQ